MRPGLLIRIDWIAGATAGAVVLALRGRLARLYALPEELLLGVANLAYASFSFTLARASRGEHVPLLRVVAANVAWACGGLAMEVVWAGEASGFGMLELIGEAFFVGGLGVLEWRAARG